MGLTNRQPDRGGLKADDAGRDAVAALKDGAVRGIGYDTYSVFYSIPYAAPPSGAGRFRAPEPPLAWPGIRDASRRGATSPQPVRGRFGALDVSPYFAPGWIPGSEYLTVNVWAPPTTSRPAPVLVFLHGGGFLAGSSHSLILDGRRFAEDGIVLVTINYRLGIPGFLDLPTALPNRGLADALAALAWVQRNIASLGGDPTNVTLAGQSAGATLTAAAVASPDAEGLFRRAIMQSGSGTGAFMPDQAAIVTRAAADALGIAPTLDNFINIPDAQLVDVAPSLMGLDLGTGGARDPLQKITPFSVVLNAQPADIVARGRAQTRRSARRSQRRGRQPVPRPERRQGQHERRGFAGGGGVRSSRPRPAAVDLLGRAPSRDSGRTPVDHSGRGSVRSRDTSNGRRAHPDTATDLRL